MLQIRYSAVALGIAAVLAAQTAGATNGYMSHAYSPAAKGMAGAGEAALPQDAMSIVGNPAGLTRVGNRLDVGAAWFSPDRKYKGVFPDFDPVNNPGGATAPIGGGITGRGEVDSRNNDFLIPNFGVSYQIDDVSAVGFALFGNGGMNSDYRARDTLFNVGAFGGNNGLANPPHYPPNDPLKRGGQPIPGTTQIGGGNAGVNLEQLGLAFSYAREMSDNLSLGASFLLAYQTIEVKGVGAFQGFTQTFTQSMIANQTISATSPGHLSDRGSESAFGYGFQLGALWDVNEKFSIGASLRSKIYMGEFDAYKDLFAEGGDFDVPAVGTIGVAFRPNDKLTLALDVQQIWYSDVDAIGNRNDLAEKCNLQNLPGYDPSYCLGGDNGAGFGWNDMTILKLGVQYAINDTLTVRAGYSHGNQPIDSREVAFNTLAPAVIEDHWTVGATYRLRDDYELTFWGMYAPEETVKGPGQFTGTQAPEISMSQFELGVNFGWKFK